MHLCANIISHYLRPLVLGAARKGLRVSASPFRLGLVRTAVEHALSSAASQVIGVIQLINKLNNLRFNRSDEELIAAFCAQVRCICTVCLYVCSACTW